MKVFLKVYLKVIFRLRIRQCLFKALGFALFLGVSVSAISEAWARPLSPSCDLLFKTYDLYAKSLADMAVKLNTQGAQLADNLNGTYIKWSAWEGHLVPIPKGEFVSLKDDSELAAQYASQLEEASEVLGSQIRQGNDLLLECFMSMGDENLDEASNLLSALEQQDGLARENERAQMTFYRVFSQKLMDVYLTLSAHEGQQHHFTSADFTELSLRLQFAKEAKELLNENMQFLKLRFTELVKQVKNALESIPVSVQ